MIYTEKFKYRRRKIAAGHYVYREWNIMLVTDDNGRKLYWAPISPNGDYDWSTKTLAEAIKDIDSVEDGSCYINKLTVIEESED